MIRFIFAFHEFVCPLMWPFQLKYSDDMKHIYCLCTVLNDILLLHSLFCQVAQTVKREMESAVKLYVKLKAKVKVGPSWGNLQDLDI